MQKKIIYFLTSIAFLLIIFNVYVESNSTVEVIDASEELYVFDIDSIFINTLFTNGIIEKWIKAKPISNKRHDSLKHVYYIDLPKGIHVVTLLSDIAKAFHNSPVELIGEERENHSISALKIYSNNVLKFEAFLKPNNKLEREFTEICFVADLSNKSLDEILPQLQLLPISYTSMIIPSKINKDFIESHRSTFLSYAVYISDNIDDGAYKIEPEKSKNQLAEKIENLTGNFSDAKAFIIDESSAIYNSVAYSFVREQLSERNKSFIEKSKFIDLSNKQFNEVISIFDFHCENGKSKQKKEMIISLEDLIKLIPQIRKQQKLGHKFVMM